MIDEKGFGKRLEICMKKANYNNSKMTKELELSKNAIGNYKNNQIPNATILYKISQLLGTTMEYLLTGKEDKNLTEEENKIIQAYKNADTRTKEIVKFSLQPYMEQETKLSNSKIG